jgi:cobalt-precorrin 5A hydrolase
MIVAGVGCRRGVAGAAIAAMVRRAASVAGCEPVVVAAAAFKADEAGVAAAASVLGVPVVWVGDEALAAVQGMCVTRSDRVAAAVGVASVAEGCALAAAGDGARLVLARIAADGVTCALAEGAGA